MATFGTQSGLYCLGFVKVTTPGTPVLLSLNVPIIKAPGNVPLSANEIILWAPGPGSGAGAGNTGNVGKVYLCYRGGNRATPNSIIIDLPPGTGFNLSNTQANSPYDPLQLTVDADNANDGFRITLNCGT